MTTIAQIANEITQLGPTQLAAFLEVDDTALDNKMSIATLLAAGAFDARQFGAVAGVVDQATADNNVVAIQTALDTFGVVQIPADDPAGDYFRTTSKITNPIGGRITGTGWLFADWSGSDWAVEYLDNSASAGLNIRSDRARFSSGGLSAGSTTITTIAAHTLQVGDQVLLFSQLEGASVPGGLSNIETYEVHSAATTTTLELRTVGGSTPITITSVGTGEHILMGLHTGHRIEGSNCSLLGSGGAHLRQYIASTGLNSRGCLIRGGVWREGNQAIRTVGVNTTVEGTTVVNFNKGLIGEIGAKGGKFVGNEVRQEFNQIGQGACILWEPGAIDYATDGSEEYDATISDNICTGSVTAAIKVDQASSALIDNNRVTLTGTAGSETSYQCMNITSKCRRVTITNNKTNHRIACAATQAVIRDNQVDKTSVTWDTWTAECLILRHTEAPVERRNYIIEGNTFRGWRTFAIRWTGQTALLEDNLSSARILNNTFESRRWGDNADTHDDFDGTSNVNSTSNTITLNARNGFLTHDIWSGDYLTYSANGNTPICPEGVYYAVRVSPTQIGLAATRADATREVPILVSLTQQTGTHQISGLQDTSGWATSLLGCDQGAMPDADVFVWDSSNTYRHTRSGPMRMSPRAPVNFEAHCAHHGGDHKTYRHPTPFDTGNEFRKVNPADGSMLLDSRYGSNGVSASKTIDAGLCDFIAPDIIRLQSGTWSGLGVLPTQTILVRTTALVQNHVWGRITSLSGTDMTLTDIETPNQSTNAITGDLDALTTIRAWQMTSTGVGTQFKELAAPVNINVADTATGLLFQVPSDLDVYQAPGLLQCAIFVYKQLDNGSNNQASGGELWLTVNGQQETDRVTWSNGRMDLREVHTNTATFVIYLDNRDLQLQPGDTVELWMNKDSPGYDVTLLAGSAFDTIGMI